MFLQGGQLISMVSWASGQALEKKKNFILYIDLIYTSVLNVRIYLYKQIYLYIWEEGICLLIQGSRNLIRRIIPGP